TVSPTFSTRACASSIGISSTWCAMATLYTGRMFLSANEPVTTSPEHALDKRDATGRDQPNRAARRVALDVHGDRIHRDVRRRDLDMDAERGASAAEPLRPDAEL